MIVENEPNNSAKTADSVARGGQATGVVNSEGDVDFWFVDLTAGQFFSVDVDAKDVGSLLDPVLQLFAPGTSPFLPLGPVGRPGRHFRAV